MVKTMVTSKWSQIYLLFIETFYTGWIKSKLVTYRNKGALNNDIAIDNW